MNGLTQTGSAADTSELPLLSILSSQKLMAYDTEDADFERGGMNFQMFQVPDNGITHFPTATTLGPHQENQILPGPTSELVGKVQASLCGVTMEEGHFDLNTTTAGENDEDIYYPAVQDAVNEENRLVTSNAWATSTITSLLKDNRKDPGLTVGFRTQPCPVLPMGGGLTSQVKIPPLLDYLRLMRPMWVPTTDDGDLCPNTCGYRCMEAHVFGECTMPGFSGVPFNNTHLYRAQMESVEDTERKLNINIHQVNAFINDPSKPAVKGINFYLDTMVPQSLLQIAFPAPIMPRVGYFPLTRDKIDPTPRNHHCHKEAREDGRKGCKKEALCASCQVDPITVLPEHLAEGYPLTFEDAVLGNIAILWRKCTRSNTYHGLCTVFFSKQPIRWKFEGGLLLDPPANFLIGGSPLDAIKFRKGQHRMNMEAKNYPHRVM